MRWLLALILLLTPFIWAPSALAQTGALQGIVVDAVGAPLPGASVVVDGVERAATGVTGAFLVRGLAPGRVRVVVRAVGFPDVDLDSLRIAQGQTRWLDVVVAPSVPRPALRLLTNSGKLIGRVLDAVSEPVPGAVVRVRGNGSAGVFERESVADGNGRFYLGGDLPMGVYLLSARALGFRSDTVHVVQDPVHGVTQPVWFRLVVDPTAEDRPGLGEIHGHVVVALSGVSLSGVEVSIPELGRQMSTDYQGAFAFWDIPAGRYTVRASRPGFATHTQTFRVRPSEVVRRGVSLDIDPDSDTAVGCCGLGGTVAGLVTDSAGSALQGAQIFLPTADTYGSTDLDGRYIVREVPPGVHEVRVTQMGFETSIASSVRVVRGDTARVDATLRVLPPSSGSRCYDCDGFIIDSQTRETLYERVWKLGGYGPKPLPERLPWPPLPRR